MTEPIWEFRPDKPAPFEDYASYIIVYPDRVEYTLGWTNPETHVIPADKIMRVKRGIMSLKNIVIITTEEWPPHEIISSWDRYTQDELVYAIKQLIRQSPSV